MDRLTHVYDCTSNLIFLDQYILHYDKGSGKLSNDQYLQAVEAITSPSLIFELNDTSPVRYYYRTNGFDTSLLLGVSFTNGMWKVKEYFENPSVHFLLALLKQHLQDGKITIYLENEIENNALGSL